MKKRKTSKKANNKTYQKAPGYTSGSRSFQKLIAGGIILSTATLVISLFAYFQPSITDMIDKARHKTEISLSENNQPGNPDKDNSSDPETKESESVPFLESTKELGEISDLSMEDSYEEEISIYSVMLDTSMGPMLYYNQSDIRWAEYLYGGSDPMKKYGCGPTAVSMVINSFSPDRLGATPVELADWAFANGEYAPQGGSYHSLIPNALSAYGLEVNSVKNHSHEHAAELLNTGHILVALMGKGSLTENGHFILITKLLDNGNVHIADPNSYANSTKEWSLNQLLSELKGSHDSGAPLWAVSLPAEGS